MSRLSLAIPSKGRLKEKSEEWLAGAGFPVTQIGGERGYQAAIEGLGDVDMRLLSAREIAQGLVEGSLHAGITGEARQFLDLERSFRQGIGRVGAQMNEGHAAHG